MSHELEIVNGKAMMAYAGDTPWHGLGTRVNTDLAPREMMVEAGLDWGVEKHPCFIDVNGESIATGQEALIRTDTNAVLTNVGKGWNPVQNHEAFDFFAEYCAAGDMEMHTAGSLKDGQITWVLAKVNESFDVLGDDKIDSYLLLSNPHQYGKAINVRFTPIRVVCNNTLSFSLSTSSKNTVNLNHRNKFNPDMVKDQMGIAHEKFSLYKDMAQHLAHKTASFDDLITYFNEVFPVANSQKRDARAYADLSRTAKLAFDQLNTQPGADYARGSWWQALNAVTYTTDHLLGRTADARMTSAWFGANQSKKTNAVNLAVEMA
tara:strand:+ start:254 stop:1213 length:960 start_codon:yes stop_codon:yes gene_type:complete